MALQSMQIIMYHTCIYLSFSCRFSSLPQTEAFVRLPKCFHYDRFCQHLSCDPTNQITEIKGYKCHAPKHSGFDKRYQYVSNQF